MQHLRFYLIFFFLGLGAALHVRVGIEAAWMLYASAVLLLLMHFLFGNVWLAFRYLQRGKPQRAQKLLDQTRFPNLLVKRNRAYYYLAKGLLQLHQPDYQARDGGAADIRKALELGLFRANDRALAHLNLAHLAFTQEAWETAAAERERALGEQPTDLMIKDKLAELGRALAAHN